MSLRTAQRTHIIVINTNRLMLKRQVVAFIVSVVGPTKDVHTYTPWVRYRLVVYVNRAAVGYIQ
jgi:hypothetical protein